LLLTSREPLNAQGEWVFPVEGLQIPVDDQNEAIESSAAGALFVQRAQRTRVGFALSEQDRPIVARLCRLVEGTPLALELAATWVRTLSVREIVNEIERDLNFLSTTVRDLPTRHRSMRVVFDHSWELLTEEEQKILLRLSVFRGGFRREAAEQVAAATLSALATLVAKSLLRRSGENRYDLHELVRQFAADHLSENSDEQSATQERHSRYYLTLFARAIDRLTSSAQREALAELTIEMDNWRVAWEWACTHNAFALIEQTMRTFALLYDMRGWWQEGIAMASRAIDALEMAHQKSPTDRTTLIALGHILASSALLTSRLGQYTRAQAMFERSLEILGPLNEPGVLVEALTSLGVVMELTGNYARAFDLYSEGRAVATTIGDRWFTALCHLCLVGLVGITQTLAKAEDTHDQFRSVLAEWRAIGDPRFIAIVLNNLSYSAMRLGRFDEARTTLEESVALCVSVGDRWGLGYAYRGLGIVAQTTGEHQQAIDLFHKSLDTLAELGARQDVARILAEMSRSVFALGNDAEAERLWRESLRLALETQGTFIMLEALIGIARLQAKRGEIERALEGGQAVFRLL
jgi:predicted ATPase